MRSFRISHNVSCSTTFEIRQKNDRTSWIMTISTVDLLVITFSPRLTRSYWTIKRTLFHASSSQLEDDRNLLSWWKTNPIVMNSFIMPRFRSNWPSKRAVVCSCPSIVNIPSIASRLTRVFSVYCAVRKAPPNLRSKRSHTKSFHCILGARQVGEKAEKSITPSLICQGVFALAPECARPECG